MSESSTARRPVVVVTGANGLVGARTVAALGERGASVRAVVRREGTAPAQPGVEEWVGDFADPDFAARVVAGADALVTTVHPLGSERETSAGSASTAPWSSPGRRSTPAYPCSCTSRPPASTTAARRSATSTSPRPRARRSSRLRRGEARHRRGAGADGRARPACCCARRPSSARATPRCGTPSARADEGRRGRAARQPRPDLRVGARRRPGEHRRRPRHRRHRDGRRPGGGSGRGRLHAGQRRRAARPRSGTTSPRSPRRSASSRPGTTGQRGPGRSSPSAPPLGLGAARRPGPGAGGDRRRPAAEGPAAAQRPPTRRGRVNRRRLGTAQTYPEGRSP